MEALRRSEWESHSTSGIKPVAQFLANSKKRAKRRNANLRLSRVISRHDHFDHMCSTAPAMSQVAIGFIIIREKKVHSPYKVKQL